MKALAIICVMLGVAIAAAFGARNIDELHNRHNVTGRAALLAQHMAALKEEAAAEGTTADRQAILAAEIKTLEPRLAEASAAKDAIPKGAVAASTRLSGWFSANGLPFSAGVLLIAFGGILARRANKAAIEATMAGTDPTKKEAVDFGVKLATTAAAVRKLHGIMADVKARTVAGLEPLKAQVETIVREDIEPLVETKQQVISRFGMAGFAELFGPLSGAERYLNRAWVAMVDRHWDEAQASLETAAQGLEGTLVELARLQKGKS